MRVWLAGALVALLALPSAAEQGPAFVATSGPLPESQDPLRPAWPIEARLTGPTDRYAHGVLGRIPMFSRLEVRALACGACRHGIERQSAVLPDELVFEDIAPRLWDLTGDGRPEIVVVEAHRSKGARLVVWAYPEGGSGSAALKRIAASRFIGAPRRWLAPAGIGDFDGDGRVEIAYVDRPHLRQELVFLRLEGTSLVETARHAGYSNHRIGEEVIHSAVRDCGAGKELLLPDAGFSRLVAFRLDRKPVDLGPFSPAALAQAQACR